MAISSTESDEDPKLAHDRFERETPTDPRDFRQVGVKGGVETRYLPRGREMFPCEADDRRSPTEYAAARGQSPLQVGAEPHRQYGNGAGVLVHRARSDAQRRPAPAFWSRLEVCRYERLLPLGRERTRCRRATPHCANPERRICRPNRQSTWPRRRAELRSGRIRRGTIRISGTTSRCSAREWVMRVQRLSFRARCKDRTHKFHRQSRTSGMSSPCSPT